MSLVWLAGIQTAVRGQECLPDNMKCGKLYVMYIVIVLSTGRGMYAWSQVPSGGGWVDMFGPRSIPGAGIGYAWSQIPSRDGVGMTGP